MEVEKVRHTLEGEKKNLPPENIGDDIHGGFLLWLCVCFEGDIKDTVSPWAPIQFS